MKRTLAAMAVTVVALAAVAGCSGSGGSAVSSSSSSALTAPGQRPTTPAQVTILSPEPNAVVQGPNVPIQVQLTGAEIVPQVSTDIRPDQGHLHIILDQKIVSLQSGLTDTVPNVAPGDHTLQIEFVAADHAPFANKVIATTLFTVQ